jgi:hypothetical protein
MTFRTEVADPAVPPRVGPGDRAPASPGFRRDGPAPYLEQYRAQTALRKQLAAIEVELAPELERRRGREPDAKFEMHVLPNRLIARMADIGISFSWVGGVGAQALTIADGRLLVIQWTGVENETRGVAALRSAHPVRERVYRAEASDAEHWWWRVDEANGAMRSTADLVAEWLAASPTRR